MEWAMKMMGGETVSSSGSGSSASIQEPGNNRSKRIWNLDYNNWLIKIWFTDYFCYLEEKHIVVDIFEKIITHFLYNMIGKYPE